MFPGYLTELADAGTTSYKADLSQMSIVYYGRSSGNVQVEREAARLPGQKLVIGGTFNKDLLKGLWKENDYETFLSEIARAGVRSYTVDISARTITYSGSGQKYTEFVP